MFIEVMAAICPNSIQEPFRVEEKFKISWIQCSEANVIV